MIKFISLLMNGIKNNICRFITDSSGLIYNPTIDEIYSSKNIIEY